MKRLFTFSACFLVLIYAVTSVAASNYIYRKRVNWVKTIKANPKDVPLGALHHPYTKITAEQMEAMLLSIKIAKKYMLKKELKTIDVFNSWEARKFAPYLVEALSKVDPDRVVHFSIVNKRPVFILRNDRLTMGNLWVAEDGVHFQFKKLFAKLTGDYESSGEMDKLIRKAKTLRVTLDAHDGQKLSYESPTEIILDPQYNFIDQVYKEREAERLAEEEYMKGKGKKKKKKSKGSYQQANNSSSSSDDAQRGDAAERLRKLENLKKEKLISDQEYKTLREKILSEI